PTSARTRAAGRARRRAGRRRRRRPRRAGARGRRRGPRRCPRASTARDRPRARACTARSAGPSPPRAAAPPVRRGILTSRHPSSELRGRSMWDPAQYALFGTHRARPFADLVARVAATAPRLVVDVGCGDGTSTLTLTERWPGARVVGLDSSPDMLAAARANDPDGRVAWVEACAEDWDPADLGAPIDVLLTNAALQWIPGHLDLLPRWAAALAPGGWFVMQVPD